MLETPGFGNFRGNYTRRPSKCESLWKKMTCLRVAASAKAGRKALPTGRQAYSGKLNVRFTLWSNKLL
jgi:hypothetical protein